MLGSDRRGRWRWSTWRTVVTRILLGTLYKCGGGRGGFLRGLLEQMQYLPSSIQPGPSIPFQSSPQVCRLAGGLGTGILVPRTSSRHWGEVGSIRLRAGWLAGCMGSPSPHRAHQRFLNSPKSQRVCVCMCGSRAQTLHACRTRGLSASPEVEIEGEWPGPGLMSCGEFFCRAHLFGGVAADIGIGSAWPGPGPRRRRLGKVGRGGTGTGMG
jgi:hypothetical protein